MVNAGLAGESQEQSMPSLFRFLAVVGILGGLLYGAIYALATYVNPEMREITVTIPRDRLTKQR